MRQTSTGVRGVTLLLALATVLGCRSAPRRPETKQEFVERFRASFEAGDEAAVLAMAHWDGVPDELRPMVKFMLTFGLGKHKITAMKTDPPEPPPPGAMVIEGRKVKLNLEPVFLLVAEHERGGGAGAEGTSRGALRMAVGVIDGRHKFCCLVWDDDGTEPESDAEGADGPRCMSLDDIPLDTEISMVEAVSLKRTDGSGERGRSIRGADGWRAIKSAEFHGQTARSMLLALDMEGRWFRGLGSLPDGTYDLEVSNLPKPPEEVFDLCRQAFEGAFLVRITVGPAEWEAYRITPPKGPIPAITACSKKSSGYRTTGKGYEVFGHTYADFADWLASELDRPVEMLDAPEGRFRFVIETKLLAEDPVLEWLKRTGFKIEETTRTVPTVLIEPKGNARPAPPAK